MVPNRRIPLSVEYCRKSSLDRSNGGWSPYSAKPSSMRRSASGMSSFIRVSNTVQLASSAATWRRQVKVPQAMWRRSSSPMRRTSSCMPGRIARSTQILCQA
ncbi:Uncharacterised protein [Mycobacterium tuberculosis]|nr:Uncharacterised protein [Mycobacterium tuberculosis]